MRKSYKSRIASLVLALSCISFAVLPAAAKEYANNDGGYDGYDYSDDYDYDEQDGNPVIARSYAAGNQSPVTLGGGSDPLEVRVYPNGSFGVFIDEYNPAYQYYNSYAYGTIWFVNGQKYATEYLSRTGAAAYTDRAGSIGFGNLTQSGNTATVTWNIDNLVFTQNITLQAGSRSIQQSWSVTNNTGAPITDVKMITGGDTYFAGDDYGYAGRDGSSGTVYVMRDATSGMMSYIPVSRQPNRYFAGNYSTGKGQAMNGSLNNTIDNTRVDQSYYFQYDIGNVNSGQSTSIRAQQSFSESGEVMVAPPADEQLAVPGEPSVLPFILTNPTNQPIDVNLSATSASGYPVTIQTSSASPASADVFGAQAQAYNAPAGGGSQMVTIPAGGNTTVYVHVDIPANAAAGAETITLTGTYTDAGNQTQTITVSTNLDVAASGVYVRVPEGQNVQPGSSATYSFTVVNAYADLPQLSLGFSAASSGGYVATVQGADTANLDQGDRTTVTVQVDVPADAANGTRDTLTLTANYTDNANTIQSASGSVTTTVGSGSGGNGGGTSRPGGGSSSSSDRDSGIVVYRGSGSTATTSSYTPSTPSTPAASADTTQWLDSVAGLLDGATYRSSSARSTGIRSGVWATMGTRALIHNTTANGAVQVQITVPNASKVDGDLLLSGSVSGQRVNTVKTKFEKWFTNTVAVVSMEQQSAWGQSVRIAAKVDLSGLDADSLVFYAYNKSSNTFTRIANPQYKIDANGYLCFYTELAGDIVITDQALTKR